MGYDTISHAECQVFSQASALSTEETRFGLILIPGPIVSATAQERIYWPFVAAGFAFTMASSSALKFSASFCVPKDALPIGQWMMFVLSRRYAI